VAELRAAIDGHPDHDGYTNPDVSTHTCTHACIHTHMHVHTIIPTRAHAHVPTLTDTRDLLSLMFTAATMAGYAAAVPEGARLERQGRSKAADRLARVESRIQAERVSVRACSMHRQASLVPACCCLRPRASWGALWSARCGPSASRLLGRLVDCPSAMDACDTLLISSPPCPRHPPANAMPTPARQRDASSRPHAKDNVHVL